MTAPAASRKRLLSETEGVRIYIDDETNRTWAESDPLPVERNIPAMLVLRPGDKVLVALVEDPPPEEAQQWARQLHMAFKGVEFTICGGVAGLAVLGGGDRG